MRRRLAFLIASFVVLADRAAFARDSESPIPVRLTLDAPGGCPDRQAFLDQVKARSARIREAGLGEPAPSMRVELLAGDGEVIGKLTLFGQEGDEGHRELRGENCASVASGLALVAAVILDPTAALAGSAAPPQASPTPAPAPATEPSRPTVLSDRAAASSAPPSSPPRFSLGWALAAAVGLGPDPEVIPRVFIDLELAALPVSPSGRLSVGQGFKRSVSTPNGTADITLNDVRFEPCADAWSPGTFRARVCGVVELGILSGEGKDTRDPQSGTRASVQLGLAVRPTWIVRDQIVLGILLAGAVPLARYRFYFDTPDTTAYRLAAASAIAEASIGVRFW